MIRQILHQFDIAKKESLGRWRCHLSWRQLCEGQVPYASLMRWRKRQRQGTQLWQSPGPKKSLPLDWSEFYPHFICGWKHSDGSRKLAGLRFQPR
jgi:hypothetical protein